MTAQQAIRDIIWKHCVGDAEKAANEIAAYLTRLDAPTAAGDKHIFAGKNWQEILHFNISRTTWGSDYFYKEADIIKFLENLTPAPQNAAGDNWISVDKEKPKRLESYNISDVVLCWHPSGFPYVGFYDLKHREWYTNTESPQPIQCAYWQPLPKAPTATADLLPNLDKSTANWSKIKDKDRWLRELRGHEDNPTASKHPKDSGIERPEEELGNTEVNLLQNLIKVNKVYAQQLEQTVKELTEQLKQKG
jgi:hypothetical protein